MQSTTIDHEAQALARCYALLLRKAAERRARLAAETAVSDESQSITIESKPGQQSSASIVDRAS